MSSKSRSRRGKRTPSRRAAIDRIVRDELAKTARREGIILDMDFYHTWDAACRGDEEVVYMDMDTDCGGGAEGVSDLYRNWEDTTSGGSVYGEGVYGGGVYGVYGEAAPSGGSRGMDKGINIDADFFNKWDADCGPEGTRNVLPALIANAAYEAAAARAVNLRILLTRPVMPPVPPVPPAATPPVMPVMPPAPTPPVMPPSGPTTEREPDATTERKPDATTERKPDATTKEATKTAVEAAKLTVLGLLFLYAKTFLTPKQMKILETTTWTKIDKMVGHPDEKITVLEKVLNKAAASAVKFAKEKVTDGKKALTSANEDKATHGILTDFDPDEVLQEVIWDKPVIEVEALSENIQAALKEVVQPTPESLPASPSALPTIAEPEMSAPPTSVLSPAIGKAEAPPSKSFLGFLIRKVQSIAGVTGIADTEPPKRSLRGIVTEPEPEKEITADQMSFKYVEKHPSWLATKFAQMDISTLQTIGLSALGLIGMAGMAGMAGIAGGTGAAGAIAPAFYGKLGQMVAIGAAAGRVGTMMPGM